MCIESRGLLAEYLRGLSRSFYAVKARHPFMDDFALGILCFMPDVSLLVVFASREIFCYAPGEESGRGWWGPSARWMFLAFDAYLSEELLTLDAKVYI